MVDEQLMAETDAQNLIPRGPGEVLKVARNRIGLSLEQVAQYLHLPLEVVDALESDNQDKLPEPAYVKGYIRSYGRYLELDVEPLIESYIKYVQPPDLHGTNQKLTEINESTGALGWLTLGGATLLIAFVSAWWIIDLGRFGQIRDDSELIGSDGAPVMLETNSSHQAVENAKVDMTEAVGASVGTRPAGAAEPTVAGIATTLDKALHNSIKHASSAGPSGGSVEKTKAPTSASPIEIETSTEAASNHQGTLETRQTVPGEDSIQLIFDDHSWAEVYDASENRLLFGLMSSGTVERVQGSAPFTVLLGNSPTVKIMFNGEQFDHSHFDRWDKTAHFQVGDSSTN